MRSTIAFPPSSPGPYLNTAHDRAVAVLARAEADALASSQRGGRRRGPVREQGRPRAPRRARRALHVPSQGDSSLPGRSRRARERRLRNLLPARPLLQRKPCPGQSPRGLFGVRHAMPHLMFASAVFYPGERHEDCVVELDDTCRFVCRNGIWTRDSLHDGGAQSAKLGQILHAVDQRLREALDYPHQLKGRGDPKYLAQIIDREARDFLEWRRTPHTPPHRDRPLQAREHPVDCRRDSRGAARGRGARGRDDGRRSRAGGRGRRGARGSPPTSSRSSGASSTDAPRPSPASTLSSTPLTRSCSTS